MPSHARRRAVQEKNKTPEKGKSKRRILPIIISSILVLLVGAFAYIYIRMSSLNQPVDVGEYTMAPETEEPTQTLLPETQTGEIEDIIDRGTQTQAPSQIYANPKAINILLLGLDTRDPKQFSGGRTDSIIICTLDEVNKEIKLTSIMRDTLVNVPGHDLNRINTVFGYCGPKVAMETVSKYFGVKIDYYAVVNFWALANIIDSLGGVKVSVESSEIENLNLNLDEINKYAKGKKSPHLKRGGEQKLDGKQAVAYMRIRHVGHADFERTERQRKVLQAISRSDLSLTDVLAIVDKLPENIRTNAKQLDMINLANIAFGLKGSPIKQMRMPADKTYKMSRYKGMSIILVDFEKNAALLKKFMSEK